MPNSKLNPEQVYNAEIGFVQVINNKKAAIGRPPENILTVL